MVSRGYKRESKKDPLLVSDGCQVLVSPSESGDEPYLMARELSGVAVAVGSNRYHAARLVVDTLATEVVILDDGFQNRSIKKDLELLLISSNKGFGNSKVLPAGPLREPLQAISRAGMVVLVRKGRAPVSEEPLKTVHEVSLTIPVETVDMVIESFLEIERGESISAREMTGVKVIAFCGIGDPEGFFSSLEEMGIRVAKRIVFPDHHRYTHGELSTLAYAQKELGGVPLVTTAKDAVNLPPPPHPEGLWIARLGVEELPNGLVEIVEKTIDSFHKGGSQHA